jgi:hypothetical protein
MSLTTFLQEPVTKVISAISSLLVHNKEWRDRGEWVLEYKYKMISDGNFKKRSMALPSTINIKINDDNTIRFIAEKYEPWLPKNTGLRLKAQFVEMMRILLGMPGTLDGVLEWIDVLDVPDAMTFEDTDIRAAITTRFSMFLTAIRKAKYKIRIQPSTLNAEIAQLFTLEIMKYLVVRTMESAEWEKGLKDAGPPLNSEVLRTPMTYRISAEPEGLVTWVEYWKDVSSKIGLPVTGPESWTAMADLRESCSELTTIYNCSCAFDDISQYWKTKDYTTIQAGLIRFFDLKDGYWPTHGVKIWRDGTISFLIPDDFQKRGLIKMGEIDEWMQVFFTTMAYSDPLLKISLQISGAGWEDALKSMGIHKPLASVAYEFRFQGIALPVHVQGLKPLFSKKFRSTFTDLITKLSEAAKLTPQGKVAAAVSSKVKNLPRGRKKAPKKKGGSKNA